MIHTGSSISYNKNKIANEEKYFSCPNSPYNWELSSDPYNDIRGKKFVIMKKHYSSMDIYKSIIEPLFHIECKEPLRKFNENINNGTFKFVPNAVKVNVQNISENGDISLSSSSHNVYNINLTMPNYFLLGYDGMNYNKIAYKNKEKRSAGPIKKQDLLYLAKVSDDFKERYFETLMFFDDTIGINSDETKRILEYLYGDSYSLSFDEDEDELINLVKLLSIAEELEPETQLSVVCKSRMTNIKYHEFLNELRKERGQWICYHIMSFSPIKKEYRTLYTLVENPSLPICNIVTSGKIGDMNRISNRGINPDISDIITNNVIAEYNLNPSQAAILKKIRNRKISLVQGPPGTGKTTTIISIIIRALIEAYVMENSIKILVCAPSNYACDEIMKRLEKEDEKKEYIKSFRYKVDDKLTKFQLVEQLNKANVVVCTLCSSGNSFIKDLQFNLLIVDEACQCSELTVLIPFCYNINQSVLIGDPKQLPPTIKNHKIEKCGYGVSLFERLQEGSPPNEVFLLDTQYRMHPSISKLSSNCFYDGKIKDGPNVKSSQWIKGWIKEDTSKFGPVIFYDIKGNESNGRGSSFCNEKEADQVINCIFELLQSYPNICFNKKISIISPYSAQVNLIKKKLKESYIRTLENTLEYIKYTKDKVLKFYGNNIEMESDKGYLDLIKEVDLFDHINVSTVDGFQGQENDIVIISTVRSDGKIGFLKDKRRLNVSISRSRYSLIIFGDSSTLKTNKDWRRIMTDILLMGCFKTSKNDDDVYFNESYYFPSNLLPKNFFESLEKEKGKGKAKGKLNDKIKDILLNSSLENEIKNEFISHYNVPSCSSGKSKILEKNLILLPSYIIGFCFRKMMKYQLFHRLESFMSVIIASIKEIASKNIDDNYFWLSNVYELKCIIETIYKSKEEYRKEGINISGILNSFNNLMTELYNNIWRSLYYPIIFETELGRDIIYYLDEVNDKLTQFYVGDTMNTQLLEYCIELICKFLYIKFKSKEYEIITNSNGENQMRNYKAILKKQLMNLKKWCSLNGITNNTSCDQLLHAISTDTNYLTDSELINCNHQLNMDEFISTPEFKIPPYKKVKLIKISNIPNSAYLTSSLFELKD